jgi:hypothetical protein
MICKDFIILGKFVALKVTFKNTEAAIYRGQGLGIAGVQS